MSIRSFHQLAITSFVIAAVVFILSACRLTTPRLPQTSASPVAPQPEGDPQANPPSAAAPAISPTLLATPAATSTPKPSATASPTFTLTPTIVPTPTITPTPTFDFPDVHALMQAFCRYGPGKAYLYAYGLSQGEHAEVRGRNYSGSWLFVKPDKIKYFCWVAASVVEIQGDINTVRVQAVNLPHSNFYGPPGRVSAERDGNQVEINWERIHMTQDDDRGYLIEATICQNGQNVSLAVQTNDNSYQFDDEHGCPNPSGGRLYTVDKHGYSDPVDIPWP